MHSTTKTNQSPKQAEQKKRNYTSEFKIGRVLQQYTIGQELCQTILTHLMLAK